MSRIEDIKERMRALERELAALSRFGDGARFVEGDVIRWRKTFVNESSGVPQTYTYAALKTPRGWYCTGGALDRRKVYDYDDLITFITGYGPAPENVEVAAQWIGVDQVGAVQDDAARRYWIGGSGVAPLATGNGPESEN